MVLSASAESRIITELQQSLESRALELAYEKNCNNVTLAYDGESDRLLRVHVLLLKDENDELQSRINCDQLQIAELQRTIEKLRGDLSALQVTSETAQGDLRMKLREIETMKAELQSLHGVTMDSTKLLTEKLTLARELSSLRPEVEHLRSQAISHQSLLAEKLALQRQVTTMQVELESEKRSTQRVLARENKVHAEDTQLESRILALQAELAQDRRDRQRIEREAQKASKEFENTKTSLESRLDAFRSKLKTTKEQLKETQAALEISQAAGNEPPARGKTRTNTAPSAAQKPRKRAAVQIDADSIIGTPGDNQPAKRSKKGHALMGEKSTFSITPFLNRTTSVAPESPVSDTVGSGQEGPTISEDNDTMGLQLDHNLKTTKSKAQDLNSIGSAGCARKPGAVEDLSLGKGNAKVFQGQRSKVVPFLERVEEENCQDSYEAAGHLKPVTNNYPKTDTVDARAEAKKKKRKLPGDNLGRTLFDEDDMDSGRGETGSVRRVRGFGTLAQGMFGASRPNTNKPLNSSTGTFGAISPLKRDKDKK